MRPIGYYVHHQGMGHWQRACAIARRLRRPCVLLGTMTEALATAAPCPAIALPDDAPAGTKRGTGRIPFLHYAPVGHDGLRRRTAMLAAWMAEARPALMIVDVSVEVALLARLCATPFLYVRLAGRREDEPHSAAFTAAEALIAPFPPALEAAGVPPWILRKTFHAGFLAEPPVAPLPAGDAVVAAFGRGGDGGDGDGLADAARAVPGRFWRAIGPVRPAAAALPPNLEILGWRTDAPAILAAAALVVGGAGDGLLAEVAAFGKRFICLPESRPFQEQCAKAERLASIDAAIRRDAWPTPQEWPDVIREAEALDPSRIGALHERDAVARTACFIDEAADRADRAAQ